MLNEINEQWIDWAASDAGLDEDAVRKEYSGRAMYGKTCLGIVYDSPGYVTRFVNALRAIVEEEADEFEAEELFERMLDNQSGDSMGRSAIAYWPFLAVEGYAREARS